MKLKMNDKVCGMVFGGLAIAFTVASVVIAVTNFRTVSANSADIKELETRVTRVEKALGIPTSPE